MMLLRTMTLLLLCFTAMAAHAYEPDFRLDGSFIVEGHDISEKTIRLQVWHIELLRGLVNEKQAFTDFSLVIMHLSRDREHNNYSVKDIEIHEYIPDNRFNSLLFANNSFSFEFGALRKLNVKIGFNEDGTLANITGSLFYKTNPANVTTFKLVKDSRQVRIIQDNSFVTKEYLYQKRR